MLRYNENKNKDIKYKNMEHDEVLVQKMIFIYNALKTGWSVKMLSENKFEFRKKGNKIKKEKKEVNLDDYLRKFIQYNLNIENIR